MAHQLKLALLLVACAGRLPAVPALPPSPDVVYGQLFEAVQEARVYPDQKTFADCTPRLDPVDIASRYRSERKNGPVDPRRFVEEYFTPPADVARAVPQEPTIEAHIAVLWDELERSSMDAPRGSTLLRLPEPYVVPGGRFREFYYWDSYFTMLGLLQSGKDRLAQGMLDDFAEECRTYGFIPNGNRTYFLSRSQPPFLALMVRLMADRLGPQELTRYRDALEAEHAYWMDGTLPTRHGVTLPDGSVLSRYWDRDDTPRPEEYANDVQLAAHSRQAAPQLYRNLRSAAESGWDFSSRWLQDCRDLGTIDTTDIVPVDLNALLFVLEETLADARQAAGERTAADEMRAMATRRHDAILGELWSPKDGFFHDYDLARHELRPEETLAGAVPLFCRVASQDQANLVAGTLKGKFLFPGGLATSLVRSGQQWDAPNGWAPLEWMAAQGLMNYGHKDLALEIARRWTRLNRDVYERTGRMEEKYDVEDAGLRAGGGEYPTQDGFGWTNGVFLALERMQGRP
ncbi:MAG TPA: alpha,alpha-trehalase TreA [Opitutaceae bacterium]